MYGLRRALFGTSARRILSLLLVNAAFFSVGRLIHNYVLESTTSPGLSFGLVVFWMALGAIAALVTVISLGERIFHRGWSERFLLDEMAALDARIEGRAPKEEVEDDDLVLAAAGGDSPFRFGLYFFALVALELLGSNALGGDFLQRYSHPGVAVIHMRHEEPRIRRIGLTMLTERLDFTVTPAVARVVLRALDDPDEGVAARAAFVAGTLQVEEASGRLARMVREQPALAFTAMIALGQIGGEAARAEASRLAKEPNARAEPRAMALMLGLVGAAAPALLKEIYQAAPDDERIRTAAVYAVGRVPDKRQLEFLSAALEDQALVVRCAAAGALEALVVFEASPALRAAFARSKDPLEMCPESSVPVQEGGRVLRVVHHRNYQYTLLRALATTDDPILLTWLVDHQEGREYNTNRFMKLKWEDLRKKDARGELNHLKQRVRLQKLKKDASKTSAVEVRPEPDR